MAFGHPRSLSCFRFGAARGSEDEAKSHHSVLVRNRNRTICDDLFLHPRATCSRGYRTDGAAHVEERPRRTRLHRRGGGAAPKESAEGKRIQEAGGFFLRGKDNFRQTSGMA